MVKTYPDEYAITSLFVVILYCNKWEQFSHFFSILKEKISTVYDQEY